MGTGAARHPLVEVQIGDDPTAWAALGFAGDGDSAHVGQVALRFVGADTDRGRGIVGWTLAVPAGREDDGDLDGLPTRFEPADAATAATRVAGVNANGVVAIDHVVVLTPDLGRTTQALGAVGFEARRTREAGRGRLQRFFRLGEVILEVVGPAEPSGTGPAAFFGLALTGADLDATVAHLSGRIGDPKPAVQPGRRIATLRTGDDVSVPIAVMSPEPRPAPEGDSGSDR